MFVLVSNGDPYLFPNLILSTGDWVGDGEGLVDGDMSHCYDMYCYDISRM